MSVESVDVGWVPAGCAEHLTAVWDESRALFPYSTRLTDGRYINDYEHADAIRYTINSLLGLAESAQAGRPGPGIEDVRALTAAFLARHQQDVVTCADVGLLALLLGEYEGPDHPAVPAVFRRLEACLQQPVATLNMQDLAWALWGACAGVRARLPSADKLARTAFDIIRSTLVIASSRLPRHSTARYRRDIVSFGSLVYFLRAMHECARTTGSAEAEALFEHGVRYAIEQQGPAGEWPWLMHGASGRIIDPYPIFSVHQDSMAMLFLQPAVDRGVPGAADAVYKSLAWCFGHNELSIDFYVREPFFAYRSIERVERAPRLRRYFRSLAPGRTEPVYGPGAVRLNPECRSYHLGWILYTWSRQPELASFGSLAPKFAAARRS